MVNFEQVNASCIRAEKINVLILLAFEGEAGQYKFDCVRGTVAQKLKFSIRDFFSKCNQSPQFPADLVIFTEEIFNGKLLFCGVSTAQTNEVSG